MASEQQPSSTTPCATFGVDLGSSGFTVGKLDEQGHVTFVLNSLSSRKTPLLVAFKDKQRAIGTQAQDLANTSPENTVSDLLDLLQPTTSDVKRQASWRFQLVEGAATPTVCVSYDLEAAERVDGKAQFSAEQLFAMLAGEIIRMLKSEMKQDSSSSTEPQAQGSQPTARVCLAVPDDFGAEQCRMLQKAFDIANVDSSASSEAVKVELCFQPSMRCVQRAYLRRHRLLEKAPEDATDTQYYVFLDIGDRTTSLAVCKYTTEPLQWQETATHTASMGCRDMDQAMFDALAKVLKAKHGIDVTAASKDGHRLLKACSRARKVLSANTTTDVVLECFGPNQADYQPNVTRDMFEQACETLRHDLLSLATTAKDALPEDACWKVEVVGGGTCIPFVHKIVDDVFGDGSMATTLDRSSAVATGATLEAAADEEGAVPRPEWFQLDTKAEDTDLDALEKMRAVERAMRDQDDHLHAIASARNALEEFIFDTRQSADDAEHGSLFDRDATMPLLDQAEDWLWSDEAENAESPAVFDTRLSELRAGVQKLNKAFYDAKAAARLEAERQAEEDRKRWEAEAASEDKDDHDFRKLKKEDRMKYVMKNKAEATELFKDGNYAHATQRYVRALGHANKFFDLSPEEEAEVAGIKETLHLNLAMTYIKQEAWKKAQASCDEAIAINDGNPKAYYRRAVACENLKLYDDASKDAQKGAELAPNDAAMKKLLTRVEAKRRKVAEKEKKMYAKMFS